MALALGTTLYETLPAARTPAPAAPAAVRPHRLVQSGLLSLPLAARGAVSQALGADSPAYRVHSARSADGLLTASNPAQHLASAFGAKGVTVSSGTTRVSLKLVEAGYGSALRPTGSAAPRARANRVVYTRPQLSEWYANGPLGLEQGFTVARAASGHAAGPLTLALALGGNARAALQTDGHSVLLRGPAGHALRYAGLRATDARGRLLHSWLSLQGARLELRVDARGARYPVRIDPYLEQFMFGEGTGSFGFSVALSAEGTTALVGGPINAANAGEVWAFTRSGGTWKQQGVPFTPSDESGEGRFGYSLALSSDGNTALIGGYSDNSNTGAAWVFTRSGEKWTQQGSKLTGAKEEGKAKLGWSVALSADGNTALVGGPSDEHGAKVSGEEIGAAWVFTRSGEKWTQQGEKLEGVGEVEEGGFGWSVALSGEGTTALIGAPLEESTGKGVGEVGSAYVFLRAGGTWAQQGEKLTGSGEEGEGLFGESTALSSNGNTALVGAPDDGNVGLSGKDVGAAFAFTRSGATWSQQGSKLTGGGEAGNGRFAFSVSLSPIGNSAAIGGPFDNENVGAAWIFTRSAETWAQEGTKLTGKNELASGQFGWTVSLSAPTALIGGPQCCSDEGGIWVFLSSPTVNTESASEITTTAALARATVNPDGEEVTECKFEYGTSEAYGSSKACASPPGKGTSPVAVSTALSGLSPNAVYHFRIAASTAKGTSRGGDATFTTLATFNTGETKEPSKPAKASDGMLSVEASGGTGAVTIGPYGSNIGGAPLFGGTGPYFDTYRSTAASFSTIEVKDCELGGGKAIWWDNPATGWQPISEPPAHYSESPAPPCVTVTLTESTTPSVAQLTGTRFHAGIPPGFDEFGKCEAAKHGNYTEGVCDTVAEKKGVPDHRGKFEFYADTVGCFPKKRGRYAEGGCLTLDEAKGKPKGKFERAADSLSGSGGQAKFEIKETKGTATIECEASRSEDELTALKTGKATSAFTNCHNESSKCTTTGQATGTILTSPLETLAYEQGGKLFTGLTGNPFTQFSCASSRYTITGGVSGETSGDVNVMSLTSQSVFKAGEGNQGLRTETSQGTFETILTTTLTITGTEPLELKG